MVSKDLNGRPIRILTMTDKEVTFLMEDTGEHLGMRRSDWDAWISQVEIRRLKDRVRQ
jgi:hypothetical protein